MAKIKIKIVKEVDGLEVDTIKSIQIHQANALVRDGIAEIYDENSTQVKSTKSKKK